MSTQVHITAAYAFFPLSAERIDTLRQEVIEFGNARDMRGLTLIAPEGINATVCGSASAIADWKTLLRGLHPDIVFKDAVADTPVFRRWSVKRKPEIVALKRTDVVPQGKRKHLTPTEWDAMMESGDAVVIDARNDYEYSIGAFKNAIDPKIREFHHFPDAIAKTGLPKDKKVMLYCTGGIRCEKAVFAMEELGYENVYQLDGGILRYLQERPDGNFEGECFVFDSRVAVDRNLQATKTYGVCPHCGLPGDQRIDCGICDMSVNICASCSAHECRRTCSKRCAYDVSRRVTV